MSMIQRFKQFLRNNPAAILVLSFQGLLMTCAAMLIVGVTFLAEGFAVVAYFLLVAAVAVPLRLLLKKGDGDSSG